MSGQGVVHINETLAQLDADVKRRHQIHGGKATEATWLDRCAWAAMQGFVTGSGTGNYGDAHDIAVESYNLAAAMLVEKRRREGAQ